MHFAKMQGVGNDFVVVSEADAGAADLPGLARKACERKFSIGADGLLVIGPASGADAFRFRMYNPDGSEDMCGNGLRCAALWSYKRGGVSRGEFTVSTKDGQRQCELISADTVSAVVRVDMGKPAFKPADLPILVTGRDHFIDQPIEVTGKIFQATTVYTGSTHTVVFVDKPIDDETFFTYSPPFENHPLFPERTSVLWTQKTGKDRLSIRIWERGAGETLGCGTGACAAAVAAIVNNKVNPHESIQVSSKGGDLSIRWNNEVWMTGPAKFVYQGEF